MGNESGYSAPERAPEPTRDEAVTALKEGAAAADPAARATFEAWLRTQYKRVKSGEISVQQQLIELAEVYKDAGLNDLAIEAYEHAEDAGFEAGNDALEKDIELWINQLKAHRHT